MKISNFGFRISDFREHLCVLLLRIRNPKSLFAMRILGIDCGSRITGYGVIDTNGAECVLVHCGVVRPNSSEPFPLRLKLIYDGIVDVIREFHPQTAAFESLFYAANVQSALKLGHVRGVSMFAAAEANLPVFEYS